MKYATEITTGEWYGVAIPAWLRAFDCRQDETTTNPDWHGRMLWSSERAAVDCGLIEWDDAGTVDYSTTPESTRTYVDARTAPDEELASQVRNLVDSAQRMRAHYAEASERRARPGEGGSVVYTPLAICISNFGYSVLCDRRTGITRRFGA